MSEEPADFSIAIGLMQAEIRSKQSAFKIAAGAAETHRTGWERENARARELEQALDQLEAALGRLVQLQDETNPRDSA